jgi:PAS domain S-box-containing protein
MIDSLPLPSADHGHRAFWRATAVARTEAGRYAPAVVSIGIALILALGLRRVVDPTGLFLVGVAIATWSRGWQAGLLAAALATITVDYFFTPPLYSVTVSPTEFPRLAVFVVCALAVNWASDARRIAADRARRESERELAAVFDEAPIGIALIDATGHAFKTNRKLRQMLGYTQGDFRRLSFTKMIHPPGVESDWNLFAELAHGKRHSYQLEKRCVTKSGRMLWTHMTVSLVRSDHGEPQFGIALVAEREEEKREAIH